MDSHNMPVTPEEYRDAVTVIINKLIGETVPITSNATYILTYRERMILKKLTRDFQWNWDEVERLNKQITSGQPEPELEYSGKPNDIDQPRGVGLAGD